MKTLAKTRFPLALAAILIAGWTLLASPAAFPADPAETTTVVHLSKYSNDVHAVFMALKIAGTLQENGQDVILFVDLEGARLADARVPNDLKWGQSDATVATVLKSFTDAGGKVRVCPHCAKACGLETAHLRDGCTLLTPDGLAGLFAKASKVIDY